MIFMTSIIVDDHYFLYLSGYCWQHIDDKAII